jgi:DNA-binding NtrC family response regulator
MNKDKGDFMQGNAVFNPTDKKHIVVIDDDPEVQQFLFEIFRLENHEMESYLAAGGFLEKVAQPNFRCPDLLIIDLKLPDSNGIELVQTLRTKGIMAPVILITAHGSIETAIEALKTGVFDYIIKPVNPVELTILSNRAMRLATLEKEYQALREQLDQRIHKSGLIGKSLKMQQVFCLIDRVSKSDVNVLITGESGTGKEMVARAIHTESRRAEESFVAINCSAIPDNLLESELFGHKRGAFTGASESRKGLFEEATKGTLFLDEIGDMPLTLQSKLLRVLQERKIKPVGSNEMRDVDVRIIAATHRDLKRAITEGSFREDLYFRLCVVPLKLPPLRERAEDIPLLVEYFLKKYCDRIGVSLKRMTKAALAKLMRFSWNGNVRELENTIERIVVLSDKDLIEENEIRLDSMPDQDWKKNEFFAHLPSLAELEKEYIAYVLSHTKNRKELAAEVLGVNRKTLYRKEREYGFKATLPTESFV